MIRFNNQILVKFFEINIVYNNRNQVVNEDFFFFFYRIYKRVRIRFVIILLFEIKIELRRDVVDKSETRSRFI